MSEQNSENINQKVTASDNDEQSTAPNQETSTESSPVDSFADDAKPENDEKESTNTPTPSRLTDASHKTVNVPLVVLAAIIAAALTSVTICLAFMLTSRNNSNQVQENDTPEISTDNIEPVSMGDFDLKFLQLEKEDGKNIIYSPLSIKYALGMLSDAAAGESKEQVDQLMGDINITKYSNNDKQSLANAMFVRDTRKDEVKESYVQTLEQKYNASVLLDPFTSEAPFNEWVSSKTFGLVNNLFDASVLEGDFILANALAIDMNWDYQLQCDPTDGENRAKCQMYNSKPFMHENYSDEVRIILEGDFSKINFNGQEIEAAQIAASANNYDIVSDLGEEYIRSNVQAAYEDWLVEIQSHEDYPQDYNTDFDINQYMEQLNSNYGKTVSSTDFHYLDTESEKVFAKELQKNDNSTLEYIGIMPKTESLNSYMDNLNTEKIEEITKNLNNVNTISGFKEGVVTKVNAYIPFFNFNYNLKLKEDLNTLGVTDVFIKEKADLSQMTTTPYSYIMDAMHKADIDFSNDGIRAAAATGLVGGFGAGGGQYFDYKWDVPVEEVDLTFDKPFFFIIHEKETGETWFVGTVYNPAS